MQIYSINVTENQTYADVEIHLGDDTNPDDAHEYLAFSVVVDYDPNENQSLHWIKEQAFSRAASLLTKQAKIAKDLQGNYV